MTPSLNSLRPMAASSKTASRVLNVNVGLLGHVDSGKTSLAKALSTLASTAAFDKHPQSQVRGITLDLGFSALRVPLPPALAGLRLDGHDDGTPDICSGTTSGNDTGDHPGKEDESGLLTVGDKYDEIQFTLVDCPGHASLIKTIIGGASIIDIMVLVVDAKAGFQTQTAECLVIGELTADTLMVALNKIDLFPEEKRASKVAKMTKRVAATLKPTAFANSDILPVSASSGDGLSDLVDALTAAVRLPTRNEAEDAFLFAIDHCFQVKGQGTVVTGTIQRGSVAVGQTIEFPALGLSKKVKSMQMFKAPVERAVQGDRLGICVAQLNAKLLERGLACAPGTIRAVSAAVVRVSRIPYFRGEIKSRAKFHLTVGHETVMATLQFFRSVGPGEDPHGLASTASSSSAASSSDAASAADSAPHPAHVFSYDDEYLDVSELEGPEAYPTGSTTYAVLELESPVLCAPDAMIIGSRLDSDVDGNVCRLAFSGSLVAPFDSDTPWALKIFRVKAKGTDPGVYTGLKVVSAANGGIGVIQGRFGASNKMNVFFSGGGQTDARAAVTLHYRKYVYPDPSVTATFVQPDLVDPTL
ncbi:selenocysteine-specific elongation factor [Thecamonas trahens ATCC 50062]|uniref:Selenocysteine-specific elongation factor n=1 Tax=Thecamonas trahens ATCC 50062 TaxID=461836 RepID=A0A0L0DT04_THETB|nr:selenocysteine-specific elongation factor [Thecamonas trahens ATCC 50062]KNC55156.1 selenocysteine-specific elongation factor [Thecamonas trahens ATCC 50062]|eukprot:XP_013753211.1 selenocysteine-specific elongation factor [Thecamonas trahens ATCC 50062]